MRSLPPDRNRYEVVRGELLVTPSPNLTHQVVRMRLLAHLLKYLDSLGLAEALLAGPVDYFHDSDVYVQPDAVVAYPEELSGDYHAMKRLRLVIEIASPASARGDRAVKRVAYQDAGAETYWAVDPGRRVVEVWHPGDSEALTVTDDLSWRVVPAAPELRIPLAELFAPLPGAPRP